MMRRHKPGNLSGLPALMLVCFFAFVVLNGCSGGGDGSLPDSRPVTSASDIDNDSDGFSENTGDCNDKVPTIYPGAPEVYNDGIDQDCDGLDWAPDIDNDGDGYSDETGDCNDADPAIYPGAPEKTGDGIDQDCDGKDLSYSVQAHDNRPIDTLCSRCHTSDASVLGSPGTGTLADADDVDALHGSNCLLCHNYTGTKLDKAIIVKAIEDSINGVPATCVTCHLSHPPIGIHTEFVRVGTTGCANCHRDPSPLVDASDPEVHDSCRTCHDENFGLVSLAAGKSFAGSGDCVTCHTAPFAIIHPDTVDHSLALQLSPDCSSCHTNTTLVDPADPTNHDSCENCHDAEGALISLALGNTGSNDCVTCHGKDISTLHPTLAATHIADPGSDNVLVFAAGEHDDAMIGDGEVFIACLTCHSNNLGFVHDNNCEGCHPSPFDTLENWTGGCQEGGCHPTKHEEASDSHSAFDNENNCTQCHVGWAFPPPQDSCSNCHATYNPSDTVPPVTTSDAEATYIVPALIHFSITDNGGKVGVGTTYHRVDGMAPQTGSSALITWPGIHTLEFWSVDQAGNVESPANSVSFTVTPDITAPVTTTNALSDYETDAYITLTATDDSRGETTTYYRLNGGPIQSATTVHVPELNGTYHYTLDFWSIDWSGNIEATNTVNFTIHGGTGTLRLVWGDSDISGSPCTGDPEAEVSWEIRRGSTLVSEGTDACPWSGVNDIVVPVSLTPYYVDIWWWDSWGGYWDLMEYSTVTVSDHGQVVRLPY